MFKTNERQYFFGEKGKRLLVKEWGPEDKPVVLLIHGAPGCADHAKFMSQTPLWNTFRLIAVDRPGYGESDPQKKITPLAFALQIERLLEYLNVGNLYLISVSGGAPYSMAIAFTLKDRVKKMCSIGGVAPLSVKNILYMNGLQKKTFIAKKVLPDVILNRAVHKMWSHGFDKMEKTFFTSVETFSETDRHIILDPILGPELLKTVQSAILNGPDGVLNDIRIFSEPWGFVLNEIKAPVTLWHGDQDTVVHNRFAIDMKSKLARADLKLIKREGHYSLLLNYRDAILSDLLHA